MLVCKHTCTQGKQLEEGLRAEHVCVCTHTHTHTHTHSLSLFLSLSLSLPFSLSLSLSLTQKEQLAEQLKTERDRSGGMDQLTLELNESISTLHESVSALQASNAASNHSLQQVCVCMCVCL